MRKTTKRERQRGKGMKKELKREVCEVMEVSGLKQKPR